MENSNKKLIAKNTSVMAIQMIVGMVVGLYTGRVVLNALGVVDYGVYSVVGGVITTLSFFSNALAASSSRYIVYDLGVGDMSVLKKTVSNIMTVHLTLAFVVLLIAETVGVWFVKTQLVIPEERLMVALWVFQFSVLSFMLSILSAPFNGMLMAHERLTIYAVVNMVNLLLKLAVAFAVMYIPFDKLLLYVVLLFCVDVSNRIFYGVYCSSQFEEARGGLSFNKTQYKKILSFTGWMCVGNVASMCSNQGLNILLNMFFGPIVNAAYGLAIMVIGQATSFGLQLQVATRPQVIKSYADKDYGRTKSVMYTGAKFSFFIVLTIALPVMLEIHQFLAWWLTEVPQWTVHFVIAFLCIALIQIIGVSMYNGSLATGKVRSYQTIHSIVMILFLPTTYILLKYTESSVLFVLVLLFLFQLVNEIVLTCLVLKQMEFSLISYISEVLFPIAKVLIASLVIPVAIFLKMEDSVYSFFIVCITGFICVLASSYFIGCTPNEQMTLRAWCVEKVLKKRNG